VNFPVGHQEIIDFVFAGVTPGLEAAPGHRGFGQEGGGKPPVGPLFLEFGEIGQNPFFHEFLCQFRLLAVETDNHHPLDPGSFEGMTAPDGKEDPTDGPGHEVKEAQEQGGGQGQEGADKGKPGARSKIGLCRSRLEADHESNEEGSQRPGRVFMIPHKNLLSIHSEYCRKKRRRPALPLFRTTRNKKPIVFITKLPISSRDMRETRSRYMLGGQRL